MTTLSSERLSTTVRRLVQRLRTGIDRFDALVAVAQRMRQIEDATGDEIRATYFRELKRHGLR